MIRLVRWLLVFAFMLVGLFLIANVVVEHVAEGRLASAVQDEFHMRAKPTVDIQGFPIILRVLSGSVPRITFRATDATFEHFAIASVSADLKDISAPGGFLSSRPSVKVGSGTITARATQAAINSYLRTRGESATITFHEGRASVRAVRQFLGRERVITASGTVARDGSYLLFRPRSVRVDGQAPAGIFEDEAKRGATVRVRLPDLPGGLALYRFRPVEGGLVVEATLRNTRLDLSG